MQIEKKGVRGNCSRQPHNATTVSEIHVVLHRCLQGLWGGGVRSIEASTW